MEREKPHSGEKDKDERLRFPYKYGVYAISVAVVVYGLREGDLKAVSVGLGLAALQHGTLRIKRHSD